MGQVSQRSKQAGKQLVEEFSRSIVMLKCAINQGLAEKIIMKLSLISHMGFLEW